MLVISKSMDIHEKFLHQSNIQDHINKLTIRKSATFCHFAEKISIKVLNFNFSAVLPRVCQAYFIYFVDMQFIKQRSVEQLVEHPTCKLVTQVQSPVDATIFFHLVRWRTGRKSVNSQHCELLFKQIGAVSILKIFFILH